MKALALILIFLSVFALLVAQITGPSAVDFPNGPYQVTGDNVSGTSLSWYGWNLTKKSRLQRPARVTVRVDSVGGAVARYWYEASYSGRVDTIEITINRNAAFWVPDSSTAGNKGIPDSLFYIVPDSAGMAAGDEFFVQNVKVNPGDQYSFRLWFSTDTIKGTATNASQPVWIGDGVNTMYFAFQPADTVAAIYRSLYATSYGGPYIWYAISDTLADSSWTADSTTINTWNYRTVTGIPVMRWMRIDRIGKVAADTVKINGEVLYIQSN